jgi:23S rRNA (uridine2479-2'-O)-methyltransferase
MTSDAEDQRRRSQHPAAIKTRDARYQQWHALLDNRNKRQRLASFLVQGVDPINAALRHHWKVRALLHGEGPLSAWATGILEGPAEAERAALSSELLADLGQRDDGPPELIAVIAIPDDDLGRADGAGPVVIIDRPANPGNLGSLIRSADALGSAGVVVVGHAADLYDPRTVRASRGSLFALPCVRVDSPIDVLAWLADAKRTIVAADEDATLDIWDSDLTGSAALVIGNEATGLSRAWREACDVTVRIPMVGDASSLNAAVSGSIVLYEAFRQRACGVENPDLVL